MQYRTNRVFTAEKYEAGKEDGFAIVHRKTFEIGWLGQDGHNNAQLGTTDNFTLDQLKYACGVVKEQGNVEDFEVRPYIRTNSGITVLNEYDYIVKVGVSVFTMSDQEFHRTYSPVKKKQSAAKRKNDGKQRRKKPA